MIKFSVGYTIRVVCDLDAGTIDFEVIDDKRNVKEYRAFEGVTGPLYPCVTC